MPLGPEAEEQLKEFYNRLVNRSLEPDDPLYEPSLVRLHPGGDPIERIRSRISRSGSYSVHMLSGQRGNGKSTELRRLRAELRKEGCTVFLGDMREYMNLSEPVEITDFLISVMGALNVEVQKDFKDLAPESYWERLRRFLSSEVDFKEIKLHARHWDARLGISASLVSDTSFKQELRRALRGHVARLVKQAKDFSCEVVAEIRRVTKDESRNVVLLVDSFDQLRGGRYDQAQAVHNSVKQLFSGHADDLIFPMMHVVYTVPPYLVPLVPEAERLLGRGTIISLSSMWGRHHDAEPAMESVTMMESLMDRRYERWRGVFTREQVHRMALSSGGDLYDFFRLTQDCLVRVAVAPDGKLPVPDSIITDAEDHMRRNMLPITYNDRFWLKRIAMQDRSVIEDIQKLPDLARLLDAHMVLNYCNGHDWYDVHPLLKQEIMRA